MRQVYYKEIERTEPAATINFTFDDKIRPGEILVLRALGGSFTDVAVAEDIRFFIEVGGNRRFFASDNPAIANGMVHWSGCIPVGEGCRVGMETLQSATGEVVALHIFGELWEAEAWRKVNG